MAITSLGTKILTPEYPSPSSGAPTFQNSLNLAAAGYKVANIIQVSKAGDISKIHVRTGTTGNTSNVYTVSIQTVNLTTGVPSGTLWSTNTQKTGVTGFAANSSYEITLDAVATVAAGDLIAIVIEITTFAGNNTMTLGTSDNGIGDTLIPAVLNFNSGTSVWTRSACTCGFGVEYSDGSFADGPFMYPLAAINTIALTASSTPRMIGNKVNIPITSRCVGVWAYADADADFKITLFDSNGSTALASITTDKDIPVAFTAAGTYLLYFSSAITLNANTNYYLMIEGLGSTVSVYDYEGFFENARKALPGGTLFSKVTTATNAPTSTSDYTDEVTKQAQIGLILDGFDAGGVAAATETAYAFSC
jgi:hypothetical protein